MLVQSSAAMVAALVLAARVWAAPVEAATDRLPVCTASVQAGAPLLKACASTFDGLLNQAHRYYVAGQPVLALSYLREAQRVSPNDPRLIYEQALVDDAQGYFVLARDGYDHLKGTPLAAIAVVPSAVNQVLLGRYREAYEAFASIHDNRDAYLTAYATLWQLWLTARMDEGSSAVALHDQLAHLATGVRGASAYQQALLDLYAGNGSVDGVFDAVGALSADSAKQGDARTEAAFFAGGYLQYVRRDTRAAQQLYRRELPPTGASVERPLIEQALASH